MDTITQAALGAAVGEAVAGRKSGNRALIWGAVAGTIPDLDIIPGKLLLDTVEQLSFHRGISHSIVFAIVISPILGFGVYRLYRNKTTTTWLRWSILFFWGMFTHAILDCFTTWGTQLLWPLQNRYALKSIFVIDPLYTLPLLICIFLLMFRDKSSRLRRVLNIAGLSISSFYLLITLFNKQAANEAFEKEFARQQLPVIRYETRPAPLNNILWTVNAESPSGYYIGYYSLLNKFPASSFMYIPKDHHLLAPYQHENKVARLIDITNNWYAIDTTDEGVLLHDLRFGTFNTYSNEEFSDPTFVFTYLISKCEGQELCITNKDISYRIEKGFLHDYLKQILGFHGD